MKTRNSPTTSRKNETPEEKPQRETTKEVDVKKNDMLKNKISMLSEEAVQPSAKPQFVSAESISLGSEIGSLSSVDNTESPAIVHLQANRQGVMQLWSLATALDEHGANEIVLSRDQVSHIMPQYMDVLDGVKPSVSKCSLVSDSVTSLLEERECFGEKNIDVSDGPLILHDVNQQTISQNLDLSRLSESEKQLKAWLEENLETLNDDTCTKTVSREGLHGIYKLQCERNNWVPTSHALFGKMLRNTFPAVDSRRLGPRDNSKYHYINIKFRDNSLCSKIYEEEYSKRYQIPRCVSSKKLEAMSSNFDDDHYDGPCASVSAPVMNLEARNWSTEILMRLENLPSGQSLLNMVNKRGKTDMCFDERFVKHLDCVMEKLKTYPLAHQAPKLLLNFWTEECSKRSSELFWLSSYLNVLKEAYCRMFSVVANAYVPTVSEALEIDHLKTAKTLSINVWHSYITMCEDSTLNPELVKLFRTIFLHFRDYISLRIETIEGLIVMESFIIDQTVCDRLMRSVQSINIGLKWTMNPYASDIPKDDFLVILAMAGFMLQNPSPIQDWVGLFSTTYAAMMHGARRSMKIDDIPTSSEMVGLISRIQDSLRLFSQTFYEEFNQILPEFDIQIRHISKVCINLGIILSLEYMVQMDYAKSAIEALHCLGHTKLPSNVWLENIKHIDNATEGDKKGTGPNIFHLTDFSEVLTADGKIAEPNDGDTDLKNKPVTRKDEIHPRQSSLGLPVASMS